MVPFDCRTAIMVTTMCGDFTFDTMNTLDVGAVEYVLTDTAGWWWDATILPEFMRWTFKEVDLVFRKIGLQTSL
jgi:hypothetical protein